MSRPTVWPLVAVLLAVFLAFHVGAKQQGLSPSHVVVGPGVLRVEFVPDPRDIVNLQEGTPYTVPAGRILILTDWVVTDASMSTSGGGNPVLLYAPRIQVNGIDVWGGGYAATTTWSGGIASSGTSTLTGALRSGIRADAGQVVTLVTPTDPDPIVYGNPTLFAAGYLVDA